MGQSVIRVQQVPTDRYGSLPLSERKAQERQLVRDFMQRHLLRGRSHRIFTMPSNNWLFERLVLDTLSRDVEFVCVEHDEWRVLQGRVKTPFHVRSQQHELLSGFDVTRGTDYSGRVLWSVFHADLATILKLRRQEKARDELGSNAAASRWLDLFKLWSAAWIDYTGPLRDENVLSLRRVWSHFNRVLPVCPLVVSYGVGRETGATAAWLGTGERKDLVMQALCEAHHCCVDFELVDVLRYRGSGRQTRESLFILVRQPT